MKTNTRKTTRILCASTIAAMTLLGSVAPALTTVAAEGEINLPVSKNIISFDKKIYLDENENVPNAKIDYKLTTRAATETEKTALSAAGYQNVEDGPVGEDGTVGLTSSATTFSATESATSTDDGKKFISKNAEIDASDLVKNTSKPTVYTYTLTEEVQGEAAKFVTPEEYKDKDNKEKTKGTTRKLNIYVGYAEGSKELSVLYSTLALEDGTKVTGFENKYETSDNDNEKNAFKVTKKVTGNQGDKTAKFNFTVKITGQHSKVTASTTENSKVDTTTPTAANSTVTVTTKLKNDESLVLKGLTKGATYKVVEDDADDNGYKTTYAGPTITDGVEETVVTNDRTGTIPTGIYLNHKLPFNILGVALAGGAVALIAKKRHEDALEDEDDE